MSSTQLTRKDQTARPRQHTDPLIHHANRFLVSALKTAWHLTGFIAGVAIRIPGWFLRANKHLTKKPADKRRDHTGQ